MIKTFFRSCVRLAQSMAFYVKLESSFYAELLLTFCLTRSIENRADRFSAENSNSAQARFNVQGFMFCPRYIRENPSHVFSVLFCCVCESHCEIQRCLPSHTLRVYKLKTHVKSCVNHLVAESKILKKYKQVRLWIAKKFKKEGVRGSRSCHVVVVVSFLHWVAIGCQWSKSYCVNFNSFIVNSVYLEDSQVKSSPSFLPVWFSWVIISCVIYYSALLHDLIYLL